MGLAIFCLILGFIVGYLLRDSRARKPKEIRTENKKCVPELQ